MKTDDADVSEGSQAEFTAGVLRNIVQPELAAGALKQAAGFTTLQVSRHQLKLT